MEKSALELVEFLSTSAQSGWLPPELAESLEVTKVLAVGIVLAEDKDCMTLVSSVRMVDGQSDLVQGARMIPKAMILARRVLVFLEDLEGPPKQAAPWDLHNRLN